MPDGQPPWTDHLVGALVAAGVTYGMHSGAMTLQWVAGSEFTIKQGRAWLRVKVGGPLDSGRVISTAKVYPTGPAAGLGETIRQKLGG